MMDMSEPAVNYTVKEMLARIDGKLDAHIALETTRLTKLEQDHVRLEGEVLQRPTRGEIVKVFAGLLTAAGVLSGIIFGVVQFVGA